MTGDAVNEGVMNVNKELVFVERFAKSVRLFVHPVIDKKKREYRNGLKQK